MTIKNDFDSLQRFIFESCDIRGEIVSLHTSFLEASAHQGLSLNERTFLGEFLAAVSLLGDSLKFDGILTLQARGDGPLPLIMADITNKAGIRGIVKKQDAVELGDELLTLPEALGNAVLSITMDPDKGERYQGIVPLEGKNIAYCLNDYFAHSEQLPTFFLIFCRDNYCGGLFLQALPQKVITDADLAKDKWQTAVQLASTLTEDELFSLSHEQILYRLFHELECKAFPAKQISFACSCDEQRSSNAIAALGRQDAFSLLKDRGEIEIKCEFCGKQYIYDKEALNTLFGASH